jgi:hypothetical protein
MLRLFATTLAFLALCSGSVMAGSAGVGFGGREYSYPHDPQYQYPPSTTSPGKTKFKCPRGQAPFQGKCQRVRWLVP